MNHTGIVVRSVDNKTIVVTYEGHELIAVHLEPDGLYAMSMHGTGLHQATAERLRYELRPTPSDRVDIVFASAKTAVLHWLAGQQRLNPPDDGLRE